MLFSKTIFLFVGTGGGIGKTMLAANLLDWLSFRCSPLIRVRGFDLDSHGGLSRFAPSVDRIGAFKPREILGSIVADQVHSCFIIDPPGGSWELVKDIFSVYPVDELAFDGVRVVLVIPVTGDRETLECVLPWMGFGRAEIVLVYRKPGPGIGVEIRDSADLGRLRLPLWLEIAAGRSGESGEIGDQSGAGECRVKRLLQPHIGPQYLVDHLCSRGISLYQAAYPYSARTARELPRAEVLSRQKEINSRVGYYWSARRRYHGIGLYYGYQLTVYLGFLFRQFAMVMRPLVRGLDKGVAAERV
jgi:hypothetical protein